MKPLFLFLLLCTGTSFAASYKLSCTANFQVLDLQTQLSLRNLTLDTGNPDFDICFEEKTETYSYPSYYNYPQFNVGYGRYVGNNGFGGIAFDPFFLNNFNNSYMSQTTTSTLTLTIKNNQGTTAWQDSYSGYSSTKNSQALRALVSRIPVNLVASTKAIESASQPAHVYSSKDFEKKQLTPEEFEQIRLR